MKIFRKASATKLIVLIAIMLYILAVLSSYSFSSYASDMADIKQAKEKMQNLSTREAIDIVRLNEAVETPGALYARQAVNEAEAKREAERLKEAKKMRKKFLSERRKRKLRDKEKLEKKEAAKIAKENTEKTAEKSYSGTWDGRPISRSAGSIMGPSGRETYYNLNMSGVINIMRSMGYSESEYPYAVRSDGVKTFGGYVMVAANLQLRPKGTLIETSVGTGIVVDTGGFAARNRTQLDIATSW